MNCPQCQRPVQIGASFCDHCGHKLGSTQAPQSYVPSTGHGGAGFAPTMLASSSASTSAKASRTIHCSQCGTSAIAGQTFCEQCGGTLARGESRAADQVPSFPSPLPAPPAYQSYQEPAHQPYQPPSLSPPQGNSLPPSQKPSSQPPHHSVPPVQNPPTVAYQAPSQKAAPSIPRTVVYKTPSVKQPKLIVIGSGIVLDFGLKKEVLIGREDPRGGIFPEIDMTAHNGKENGVSREHARIFMQKNQWMIEDLNSVNYTYVNKKRVMPSSPHPLDKGDEIRLGRAILRFELF